MGKSVALIVAIAMLLTSVLVVPSASSDSTFETYVVATIGSPDTLDPAVDYESAGQEVIQNVYETLVWYNGSSASQLRPMLATEVPTLDNGGISPDGLTYTLHLRSGVRFHNGETMTSEDVRYSIARVLMINDADGPAWMLGQVLIENYYDMSYVNESECTKAIWAVDGDTVQFNLTMPYPGFLSILAYPVCSVVSKSFVEGNGGIVPGQRNAWLQDHCCGTGPYWLESMELNNFVNLRSNSEYWGDQPSIERVSIKSVNDEGTRLMMLQNGDADSIYLPRSEEGLVSSDPNVRVVKGQPTFNLDFLGLNQNIDMTQYNSVTGGSDTITQSFFADAKVRLAFAHSFDYDKAIETYFAGGAIQPNGVIPQGMFGYDASVPQYDYNLTAAAQFLNGAVANDVTGDTWGETGFTITLMYNAGNEWRALECQLLKEGLEQLEPLGYVEGMITVNVLALEWPDYLDTLRAKGLPVFFLGWAPDYADPDDYVNPFIHGSGTYAQRCGFDNATLTVMCEEAASELNETQRALDYYDISMAVYDNCYYIWTAQATNFHVERTWTNGYYYNPMLGGIYFSALSFTLPVPGPVTDLEGRVGPGMVGLFWDGVAAAESYAVYRSESPGGAKTLVATVSEPVYLDENVVDGTPYYYNVTAINSQGAGPSSVELALTPGAASDVFPLHIDSDGELLVLKLLYGWAGSGEMNGSIDPIIIQDEQGGPFGEEPAIYIANTTLGVRISNCSFNSTGVQTYNAMFVHVSLSTFNQSAIIFEDSDHCHVGNCSFDGGGVFLEGCKACSVNSNTFLNSTTALFCSEVHNSDFWYNEISSAANVTLMDYLTAFLDCDDNRIMGNTIEGGRTTTWGFASPSYGMMLRGERNEIDENAFYGCSLVMLPGDEVDLGSNIVFGGNTVNGGQLRYYSNYQPSSVVSGEMGQLILVNVPFATLRDVVISNCSFAIQAIGCSYIVVQDCHLNGSVAGLALYDCTEGMIIGVETSGCLAGLLLQSGTEWITVEGSSLHDCHYGVFAGSSNICTLIGNNISGNDIGLEMASCEMFMVHFNLFGNNTGLAVNLGADAAGCTIYMNRFIGNNGSNDTYDAAKAQAYDDDYDSTYANMWYGSLGAETTVGNLWSDWTGPDADLDGFVDLPYPLAGSANDPYPLAYLVGPPGPPTNVVAQNGAASVSLVWGQPLNFDLVGVDGYNVYRWNVTGGWELIATVLERAYLDEGLATGVEYSYQVSAYNEHGEGPRSANATAFVYTVPGAPTGLQGDMSDGLAILSWTVPSSDGGAAIDHYVVYLNGVESQVVYGSTSAEVAGLSMGVSYIFTVRAHNAAGLGEESAGLTLIERTVPIAPTLKAVWGDEQVGLTWSTPYNGGSPITGYVLYKQWPGLSNWTEVGTIQGNSYTDDGLTNGQTYAFKVRATNAIGDGKMSNVVRDFPRTVPGAPEIYALEPGDRSLLAKWAAPDDDGGAPVLGYSVYVDGVLYANTTADNMTITGLEGGISYSVKVRAFNLAGTGDLSAPISATPVSVPGAIGTLSATSEPNAIVITWSTAQGGGDQVQYRAFHRLNGTTAFVLLTTTEATRLELPMTLQDIGLARDYRVEAFNPTGVGGNATTLDVMPNVVYIAGVVLDESGVPIAGATVISGTGGQAITGADGSFIIQAQPGTVALNITKAGLVPVSKEVWVGTSPVQMGTVTMAGEATEETDDGIDLIWVLVPVLLVVGGGAAFLLLRRRR